MTAMRQAGGPTACGTGPQTAAPPLPRTMPEMTP